jgi:hypothetical protein
MLIYISLNLKTSTQELQSSLSNVRVGVNCKNPIYMLKKNKNQVHR